MMLGLIGALSLVALAINSPTASPLAWSPDGRWIAYTVAVPTEAVPLAPGWLFETSRPIAPADDNNTGAERAAYRLWATQIEGGESVLLEETEGVLSAPCWGPDGKSLAFARLVARRGCPWRFEIVVQDAPERRRVVLARVLEDGSALRTRLPAITLAWSPDGRYLAVPLPEHENDLAVIRADNGRVLKTLEDACLPAWSPDRGKLALAFVRGKIDPSLQSIDSSFGAPKHLADVGQVTQAPFWMDGNSIAYVVSSKSTKNGHATQKLELFRISIDSGQAQRIHTLTSEPVERANSIRGISFSLDHERENLFFTVGIRGQPSETVWFRPPEETRDRFPAVDFEVWSSDLSVSPSNLLLAFRAHASEVYAPPGMMDMSTRRRTVLVPDDATRVQWVVTLVNAGRKLLRGLPAPKSQGRVVERASILPVPGELPANTELASRLRHLAKLGRPLCDRPVSVGAAEPSVQALLDEARLFFDYLILDYPEALASLDRFESRATNPDQRLCLLMIRSQIYLGQRRVGQAKETIGYLQEQTRGAVASFEETPLGPTVGSILDPRRGWLRYLDEKADELTRQVGAETALDPPGHRGFEAPDREMLEEFVGNARAPRFPFAPPADDPRLEAAPDVVRPPGGEPPVAPKPPPAGQVAPAGIPRL